jgi:hypothetical protein
VAKTILSVSSSYRTIEATFSGSTPIRLEQDSQVELAEVLGVDEHIDLDDLPKQRADHAPNAPMISNQCENF